MRKLSPALVALALGFAPLAALAAPSATAAQVIVPQAEGDAAYEHMRQASDAAERVTALLVKVSSDPDYAGARSADEMRAAIAGMRGDLAASRREIRGIVARLNALPRIAGENAPVELRLVDRVVTDIAAFSGEVDGLLATVENFGDALEAGDEARIQQAAGALMRGSVTVIEGQSLMLRARLPMMPSDSSGFAQVTSLACFYEGFADFQRGIVGLVRLEAAGVGMERAVSCMTGENARGMAAIEREGAIEFSDARLTAMRDGVAPIRRSMFKELDDAAALLDEARRALVRGDTAESLTKFAQRTTAFEQRYQALVSREVAVAERQGR
ncbi:hypothetical protein [Brevundimonas sp.]|uniref:hypothetical protein n=1 Tax=Brevundimonas sp. TaxID=1871086 RepID=UPI002D35DCB9|nr:hypothetical protein [Brevundimonas sp.]HYC68319.1 hypothetical protein [Brevundimonas sp.]